MLGDNKSIVTNATPLPHSKFNKQQQWFRTKISRKIIDSPELEDTSYENLKFILQIDSDKADAIVGYNQLCDRCNQQVQDEFTHDGEQLWGFRKITGHQGPLTPGDQIDNGWPFNIGIEWESGETT